MYTQLLDKDYSSRVGMCCLMTPGFSNDIRCHEVTDSWAVRAGVSVTWHVLSWSGGHEFESRSDWTWGALYFCPKSSLNQTYQLSLHKSIWEPVHLKSHQTSKIMWQYISFEVTHGRVVRAGISETWHILSWPGGHEFEPHSGWMDERF